MYKMVYHFKWRPPRLLRIHPSAEGNYLRLANQFPSFGGVPEGRGGFKVFRETAGCPKGGVVFKMFSATVGCPKGGVVFYT